MAEVREVVHHLACIKALGLPLILFERLPGSASDYFEPVPNNENRAENRRIMEGQSGSVTVVRPTACALNNKLPVNTHSQYALKRYRAASLTPQQQMRIAIPLYLLQNNNFNTTKEDGRKHLIRYIGAYEFEKDGPALLMDWIDGETLADIDVDTTNTRHRWVCWMRDIAEALAYLHQRGIVHRDVHRGNILVHRRAVSGDRKDGNATLIDLDLACAPLQCNDLCAGPVNTETTAYDLRGGLSGKPDEAQWRANDVFALGVTFLGHAANNPKLLEPLLTSKISATNASARDQRRQAVERSIDSTTDFATKRYIDNSELRALIQSTLSSDWKKRPTARDLAKKLSVLCGTYENSANLSGVERNLQPITVSQTSSPASDYIEI